LAKAGGRDRVVAVGTLPEPDISVPANSTEE
jgi:hypothetical protein